MAWLIVAFLPLMLAVGATTGHQSVTVTVSAIRAGKLDMFRSNSNWFRELSLSCIFAVIFSIIVGVAGYLVFDGRHLALIMACSLSCQIIFSMLVGNLLPLFIKNLGLDPTVGSIPLFTVIADVSAIAILTLFLRGFSG
jgi:Mg/Co/Ni transporter MgtE